MCGMPKSEAHQEMQAKRVALFVANYLRHFNAARAAREAGFAPKNSHRQGFEMLRKPEIQQAVAEAIEQRLNEADIDAKTVLRQWALIATANPNELIQYQRVNCRCCHGEGNRYQRTQNEFERAKNEHARLASQHEKIRQRDLAGGIDPYPDFDPQGGVGYNATREPNPDCLECFGEGVERVFVADTRDLSPGAQALIAGVKVTKDGVEVKMHDQAKAWELIAKHLGMLKDKLEVEGNLGLVERLARARSTKKGDGTDLAG